MTTKLYNELNANNNNIINATLINSLSIGVGVLSPSGTVHIIGTGATANDFIVENTTAGTSARARVRVIGDGGYGHFEFRSASSTYLPSVLQIAADTNIVINPGNAAAALAVFAADSLTINKHTIVTGGTLQLFNSGATGYLTNQTNALLYFSQSGGTYPFNNNGNLVLQSRTSTGNARDIVFATGDTTPITRMVVNSSGNIGIGTTSPGYAFTNVGSHGGSWGSSGGVVWRVDSANYAGSFVNRNSGGADYALRVHTEGTSSSDVIFSATSGAASGTTRVVITGEGNIGIGTTSPYDRLYVNTGVTGATDVGYITAVSDYYGTGTGGGAGIRFSLDQTSGGNLNARYASVEGIATAAYGSDMALLFKTTDNSAGSPFVYERMRITAEGNVGIGTTSPDSSHLVHIASSNSSNYQLLLENTTSGPAGIRMANSTTGKTTSDGFVIGTNSSEQAIIHNFENTDMYFATNNTECMRITAAGYVGINKTPVEPFEVHVSSITRLSVTSTGNIVLSGYLYPLYNNTYDIGTPYYYWKNLYIMNAPILGSDKRIKENIRDSDLGLDFINKLTPRKYDKIKTGDEPDSDRKNQYGLIAQELEEVLNTLGVEFGGLVYNEDVDRYSIRYTELISPIIKSIQELDKKYTNIINSLENKIDILVNKLNKLEGEF